MASALRGHIVLDGDPDPLPKKGAQPPFSTHVCNCGQTAEWIKMPFGTEVGLVPDHVVLDGDPALPLKRGTAAASFRPMSVVAKRPDGLRCHFVGK